MIELADRYSALIRARAGEDVTVVSCETQIPVRHLERWLTAFEFLDSKARRLDRKERRKRERAYFDDDLDDVLTQLGRCDEKTKLFVKSRRRMLTVLQWVYLVFYLPLYLGVTLLFFLLYLFFVVTAVFGTPDPRLTLAEELFRRVVWIAIVAILYMVAKWVLELVFGGIWDLFGPFALASVSLQRAQETLQAPKGFHAVARWPDGLEARATLRTVGTQLRVTERQLTKRLLLKQNYSTWAARDNDLMNRRRVSLALARVEIELRRQGLQFYDEAIEVLRTVEILTLLRDWSISGIEGVPIAESRYRGWLVSLAAIAWALLLFGLQAASLYFQEPFTAWLTTQWPFGLTLLG